ncbi:MAG: aminotransferase class I/II-fold pyridoxal phosphate-dependent enzyme, partial [Pseudomonadota bacterium]
MTQKNNSWQPATNLVRGGLRRSNFGETGEAIFMNSGFCYDSAETAQSRFDGTAPGFVYSRYSNPTLATLEDRLALMEGAGRCCVTASGMAAVFGSMMCQLKTGDHVVASKVLFGSCYYIITQILPRFGIEYTLVDGANLQEWENAFKPNSKLVFIETPANPTLDIVDIEEVCKIAKKHGSKVIIDNVFSTPLLQHPFKLGADIVVYSTTKHIEGQGRCLGGAVLGDKQFIDEVLLPFHRHTGPAMSPFNAWVTLKGLETLPLRVERHCSNAALIAEMLDKHPKVASVRYPGLKSHPHYEIAKKQMESGGPMIAFEIKGGKEAAFAFMNQLQVIDISNNLGDAKSLI